jgi:L-arabinose isomerase
VLCSFLSWSEDATWIYFLREIYELPLAYYLPVLDKMPYENTRDENDFIEFLSQGGLVGTLVGSGSIARFNRKVEVIADDFESAKSKLDTFFRAARTRSRLRNAHFGLLANYNEIMWGTYVDPYDIFARIGPELHFISYARLHEEIAGVGDAAAAAYMAELSRLYTVEPDVDKKLFIESARASLALAEIQDKFQLDALVLNDVSPELFRTIGLRPGFYPTRFHEHDAVLVPEGDMGAGIMAYMLRQLTGKHISYAEPFYIEKASGSFAAGHAGPHDYTDERYRHLVRISRDVRFAKSPYKYAGAPFAWYRIAPGLKTFAHFSEANGRFKIVCFTAESLPGEHALCSYSHSDFKPETLNAIVSGPGNVVVALLNEIRSRQEKGNAVLTIGMDGYVAADWKAIVNLLTGELTRQRINVRVFDVASCYKSKQELDAMLAEYLPQDLKKDPVLLFGKLFEGGYETLFDQKKLDTLKQQIKAGTAVNIVYGAGSCSSGLRPLCDIVTFFDVTPIMPRKAFNEICSSLVNYPFRCKPVYLEGVWGGHYIKKMRNLPEKMKNCAWIFDLIPLEVTLLVKAGSQLVEIPFFVFVNREATALMGGECVKAFNGYFPIRFNFDDSYHSSGNMLMRMNLSLR